MKPGIYPGLSMAEYLAMPAVSASLLQTAIDECPRAAWHRSWMNPHARADASDEAQSAGTVAHGILLEGSTANVVVVDAKDWRTNTAKEARDAAIAAKKTAILPHQMKVVEAMVAAAREFIDSLRLAPPEDLARSVWAAFQPGGGESEVTMVCEDDGVLCRIRPDRISLDRTLITDYKTCGSTAEPDTWGRTQMVRMGFYTSGAFYRRVVKKLCGVTPAYVFLVQEQAAPYLCSLVGMNSDAEDLGDRKVSRGMSTWRACMTSGNWPAYPARVVYPELPAWEFTREEEGEVRAGIPYDPGKMWGHLSRQALETDPAI
jgi:hypothetical protein